MSQSERSTFFRQSGWMAIANVMSGFFMMSVHPIITNRMAPEEYGIFVTLLRAFTLLAIPAAGLQTVLAQESAAALTPQAERNLAATVRAALKGTFVTWVVFALVAFVFQSPIMTGLKLTQAVPLWLTVAAVLPALWLPITQGLVQGRQNFFSLGLSMIGNGFGRSAGVAVLVMALHWGATGGVLAIWIGVTLSTLVAFWPVRHLLKLGGGTFEAKPWLLKILPLTLGVAPIVFMISFDVLVVQNQFPKETTPFYSAAAMIGVSLLMMTTPMAAVMFPKIDQSSLTSKGSNAFWLAGLGTIALMGSGAVVCTFLPTLPLRIMFPSKPEFLASAVLVPWFAWSIIPITLANIMVGQLMALSKFRIVPWMIAVAIGYAVTFQQYAHHAQPLPHFEAFKHLIQILGVFSLLALAIATWFTWLEIIKPKRNAANLR